MTAKTTEKTRTERRIDAAVKATVPAKTEKKTGTSTVMAAVIVIKTMVAEEIEIVAMTTVIDGGTAVAAEAATETTKSVTDKNEVAIATTDDGTNGLAKSRDRNVNQKKAVVHFG